MLIECHSVGRTSVASNTFSQVPSVAHVCSRLWVPIREATSVKATHGGVKAEEWQGPHLVSDRAPLSAPPGTVALRPTVHGTGYRGDVRQARQGGTGGTEAGW